MSSERYSRLVLVTWLLLVVAYAVFVRGVLNNEFGLGEFALGLLAVGIATALVVKMHLIERDRLREASS